MNYKIKIITGYRDDQYKTVDSEEAHKAYYLFNNPEKRGIFSNGVPMVGKDIKDIQPDYNATFGWNPSHKLTGDDWNEIRAKGTDVKMQNLLGEAKQAAYMIEERPELIALPLSEVRSEEIKRLTN